MEAQILLKYDEWLAEHMEELVAKYPMPPIKRKNKITREVRFNENN
jgi:hypothetical protein